MNDQRRSYWNPDQHRAYLARAREKSDALTREKDGVAVAEKLWTLWLGLDDAEKALLAAMVALGQRSMIALHDHPSLRSLISKGLITYPQGHGGNWMRAARTSYSIPPAVWRELRSLKAHDADAGAMDLETARQLLDSVASSDALGLSRK